MTFHKWRDPATGTRWVIERRNRSVWSYVAWVFFAGLIAFCVAYCASLVLEAASYAHTDGSYVSGEP